MSTPGPKPRNDTARGCTTIAGISAMLLITLLGIAYVVTSVGFAGSALVIGVATLPPIVLAAVLLFLDRMEPEPSHLLWLTFAAGGTGAVALTMIVNVPWTGVTAAVVGSAAADLVGTIVYAPVTEEIAKGAILLALFLWKRNEIHGVVDGIVYGSMVGLGFAFAENTLYFSDALAVSVGDFATLVVLRAVMSGFAHPLFTSMTGMGFAIAAEGGRYRWAWPLGGLAAAMVLHAIWNVSAVLGDAWFVSYVLFFIPVLVVVAVSGWWAARREARQIQTYLAKDVALGLLTADEIVEVSTLFHRRGAMRHYERQGGKASREARAAFHRAATRLAFLRNRAAEDPAAHAEAMRLVREIALHKRSLDPGWAMPAGIE